eukprot:CAMPEP_0114993962 /NCGR_PEP_ID=MMETSP0216-20121206/12842_1 /TAXON_ID=223996 /ORGANISM="Protocruzia adherens, Strain Boccale" /LENGTH=451 /DNA_ID=CAMNT_0002357705 /DNA_START=56 /DNA_END=1411 /DNA_ORIENTATION=+
MDEEYDVIVMGTGLKECILSGLLSTSGKKVLHLDRNSYYGGDCASLNIAALWKKYKGTEEPPAAFGHNRDWNVDLIPKFIMSNGKLVKMLIKSKVTKYLEWKVVDGTYVFQVSKGLMGGKKAGIHKVPSNDSEALKSSLMGLWEKKRCRNFFKYVESFNEEDPKTFGGIDPTSDPFAALIKKFGLEANTIDFVGHAIALYPSDAFISQPCLGTIKKIKLYMDSHGLYGDSPFIYPVYGLGGLPEGFSRLSAVYGGTYMLNQDIDEIVLDESGQVSGVRAGDQVAKCKMVIADPSYVKSMDKVKKTGQIVRCICIMDHPVPNTKGCQSVQVIIPQKQVGRNSDIYITMLSNVHCVCAQNFYIAMISANVETSSPETEIQPALDILGPVIESFVEIYDTYEPTCDGVNDKVFVTSSYDSTSHFESASEEVLSLYKRIFGEDLDLNVEYEEEEG